MNVWCHLPTIFNRRNALRFAAILTLCVAITTTLFFSVSHAVAGVNQTLSFQGRLLSSSGAVVPDGYYNIQFKIYQDGDGTAAGDTSGTGGTLKWTETYVNNGGTGGVEVKDGFFTVNLGSLTPFGTSIDWNQDTLWMSMNVAGSSSSCTTFNSGSCVADGEMLPMKRITSSPYALNSGMLGGITSSGFIQNTTTTQTADFTISGVGTADTLSGVTKVTTPLIDSDAVGTLNVGTVTASTINVGTNASDHTISIGTGNGNQTISVGSLSGTSGISFDAGSSGIALNSNGNVTIHNSQTNTDSIAIDGTSGDIAANLSSAGTLSINNSSSVALFKVTDSGSITTDATSSLGINGTASFNQGLSVTTDGTATLSSSALRFAGTTDSAVTSAGSQALTLTGDTGLNLKSTSGNVQIGTGTGSGSATVLTLDKSAAAPTGSGAVVGSMYYDTTLGAVQCYEASGWGNCTASPDDFVSLSPSYSNSVVHDTGTGTLTTDFCSDSLNINNGTSSQPSICGTNETYNYYDWTSSDTSTSQTRSIYVTYQLPTTFKNFEAGQTSLMARTDSSDATIAYQLYRSDSNGLTACGSSITASTGAQTTWQKATASGSADPSNCSFAAGDSLVVKIDLSSLNNANAYTSTLNFAYSNN